MIRIPIELQGILHCSEIGPGQSIGVCGETGSGKTRIAAKLVKHITNRSLYIIDTDFMGRAVWARMLGHDNFELAQTNDSDQICNLIRALAAEPHPTILIDSISGIVPSKTITDSMQLATLAVAVKDICTIISQNRNIAALYVMPIRRAVANDRHTHTDRVVGGMALRASLHALIDVHSAYDDDGENETPQVKIKTLKSRVGPNRRSVCLEHSWLIGDTYADVGDE